MNINVCVCRRKASDQSSTHTFPQDRAWRKTFWLCAMKAFCLLRPWERDGLIREHGPGLWEKALKVGRAFFSFISAVLPKKMQAVPFLKNEGGSDHGRPSFHRWFHFFFLIVIAVNPLVTAALASFCCWDERLTKSSSERKWLFGLHFRSQSTPEGNQDRNSRQEPENHERKLLAGLFSAGIRIQT